jgi:hypothetical protein
MIAIACWIIACPSTLTLLALQTSPGSLAPEALFHQRRPARSYGLNLPDKCNTCNNCSLMVVDTLWNIMTAKQRESTTTTVSLKMSR